VKFVLVAQPSLQCVGSLEKILEDTQISIVTEAFVVVWWKVIFCLREHEKFNELIRFKSLKNVPNLGNPQG